MEREMRQQSLGPAALVLSWLDSALHHLPFGLDGQVQRHLKAPARLARLQIGDPRSGTPANNRNKSEEQRAKDLKVNNAGQHRKG